MPEMAPRRGLFCAATDLSLAREHAEEHEWAAAVRNRLRAAGAEALAAPLPEFDPAWYEPLKDRPWEDIYPQVSEHTAFAPGRAATPALRLALAGTIDRREDYLLRAGEILAQFARSYDFTPQHWDVGMNYTGFAMPLLYAYDLCGNLLDGSVRADVDSFFERYCAAVEANDAVWIEKLPWNALNNHYTWHKWGIGAIGLFYDQPQRVRYCLEGPMGIAELLEGGLVDSGLWFESATGYHFTPLYALLPLAEALRNTGHAVDLYTHEFGAGRRLKQLLDAPLDIAFPDASLPSIGDCYGYPVTLKGHYVYEYGYRAYGDLTYAWLLGDRSRPAGGIHEYCTLTHGVPLGPSYPPPVKSRLLPEHGYAILRSGEGETYFGSQEPAAFVTFDKSGIHANADGLSLTLFACGRQVLIDAEATSTGHAFSSAVQRELNRETICHNLVMVDEGSQRGRATVMRVVSSQLDGPTKHLCIADDGALYEGVRQQRTVILTREYALDVVQVRSADEHAYDLLLHAPAGSGSFAYDVPMVPTALSDRWSHWITDARGGACGEGVTLRWECGEAASAAALWTDGPAEVLLCDFPRSYDLSPPPIAMAMLRRRTSSAVFVTLYTFARGTPAPTGRIESVERRNGELVVRVAGDFGAAEHAVPALTEER